MQKFVNVGSASITKEKSLLENLGRKLNIIISSVSLQIFTFFYPLHVRIIDDSYHIL